MLMLFIAVAAFGQQPGDGYTRIKGVVTDSVTGEGMPFAQIFLLGSQTGALTNELSDANYAAAGAAIETAATCAGSPS